MPTVRLRDESEYPQGVRKLFELSKEWFGHDFKQPPAMSRVMAWDPGFGGPHGRAMKRAMGPGEFSRGEKEMVAAAVSGLAPELGSSARLFVVRNFQVFARRVIFGYVRHSLVAHRLLDGALSRDGSLTCKLRTSSCLCYFAPTLLCQTTRLGQALTL